MKILAEEAQHSQSMEDLRHLCGFLLWRLFSDVVYGAEGLERFRFLVFIYKKRCNNHIER